jgi:hypothetical protein
MAEDGETIREISGNFSFPIVLNRIMPDIIGERLAS